MSKMNILLIVMDACRADHLGCYGYNLNTSPFMDSLAKKGTIFKQAYATNNATDPSFTTILTGLHPLQHGIYGHLSHEEFDIRNLNIAEVLRQRGFSTFAVSTLYRWFERGFDEYIPVCDVNNISPPNLDAENTNKGFRKAMEKIKEPWFGMLHYWNTHSPYWTPETMDSAEFYQEKNKEIITDEMISQQLSEKPMREWLAAMTDKAVGIARYDAAIKRIDLKIKEVVESVPKNTLIIITSDHGESLGEHGLLFDHSGLYQPSIKVPLIIYPTNNKIAELQKEYEVLVDHRAIYSFLIHGMIALTDKIIAVENSWQKSVAMIVPPYKLISTYAQKQNKRGLSTELYDIMLDEKENINLLDTLTKHQIVYPKED